MPKSVAYEDIPLGQFLVENVIIDSVRESAVLVGTDGREIRISLYGDCCSNSYFTDDSLLDFNSLLGNEIYSLEDSFINEIEYEGVYIKVHMLVIKTNKQSLSIDWRNSSNGYYGGSVIIEWINVPNEIEN